MALRHCEVCERYGFFVERCSSCCSEDSKSRAALEADNKNLQLKVITQAKDLQESQSKIISQAKDLQEAQSTIISQAKDLQEPQSRLSFLRQRFDSENSDEAMKADVAILVQDKDDLLYPHKFVLAAKSPVFCKMFESNMLESKTGLVRIEDATLPVMRAVIEFCYNEAINLTADETFEEVLEVAHKYGIDLLVKICEDRLIPTVDNVNLIYMSKLSKKYEAKRLHAHALMYFKTHFEDVSASVVEALF